MYVIFVYPVAEAPDSARDTGANGGASSELPSGANLVPRRRPPLVDGRNIFAVVRGIRGTSQ